MPKAIDYKIDGVTQPAHRALVLAWLLAVLIFVSSHCVSQPTPWRLTGPLGNPASAFAIYGANADSIYAHGYYWFLRSTNRGESWDSVSTPFQSPLASLAVDPIDHNHLLCISGGLEAPHLFESEDGGTTWQLLFRGIAYPTSIIEPHPLEPRTLYVGLGPHFLRRTSDFGHTWDTLPTPGLAGLSSISIGASNPNVLYAGMTSMIRKSTDAGMSWNDVTPPLSFGITSLVRVDPRDENIVYAGIYSQGTTPGGMYKSTNGGASWFTINNGLDSLSWEVQRLVIDPKHPNELYLGILGVAHRLFRTTNGGESWVPFEWGLPVTGYNSAVQGIAIDTLHDRIYVGGSASPPSDTGAIFVLDLSTNVKQEHGFAPSEFRLMQSYPNPFNASCVISFELDVRSFVSLDIYTLLGTHVAWLAHGVAQAGRHEIRFDGDCLSSGLYFYRLCTQQGSVTRPMLLIK